MKSETVLSVSAISGALAVIIGAFGAHGLKNLVTPELLEAYKTGVQYHFWHTLALLFVGMMMQKSADNNLSFAGIAFIIGILLFSFSLYVMAITGIRVLGAITPFGGVSLIAGWLFLLRGVLANKVEG